jgi:hypothetical protein
MATVRSEIIGEMPIPARGPRDVALEGAAIDAARKWTTGCFDLLAHEGRAIEGGWPGTMNEARARSADLAGRALLTLALPRMTHEEHGRVARITYDEARRLWRASSRA